MKLHLELQYEIHSLILRRYARHTHLYAQQEVDY